MISQDVDNHLVSFFEIIWFQNENSSTQTAPVTFMSFQLHIQITPLVCFDYIHSTTNSTFASHTKYKHRAGNHVQSTNETDSTWDHGAAMGLDEMVPRICFMMFFNEECGRLWAKLALLLTTWLHQNLHVPQR